MPLSKRIDLYERRESDPVPPLNDTQRDELAKLYRTKPDRACGHGLDGLVVRRAKPESFRNCGNCRTGETAGLFRRRKRRREVAELLQTLLEKHPTGTLYVIWDNAGSSEFLRPLQSLPAACAFYYRLSSLITFLVVLSRICNQSTDPAAAHRTLSHPGYSYSPNAAMFVQSGFIGQTLTA